MTLFSGLSAFPLTPTDNYGQLMPDLLAQNLERLSLAGVDSVGLLGSTGSYAYLSPEERKRTVRAAADALGGRVPLIVGVGALRTDEAEGCCQTNSNQSQFAPECVNLCGTKLTPLRECGGSVELEVVA